MTQTPVDFYVYSRQGIGAIEPHLEDHIIVSVTTPRDPPAKLPIGEHTKGVLRMVFDDVDKKKFEEDVLFTRAMAEEILAFTRGHKLGETLDRFLVHCDAGYSRSPGIAAALSLIHNNEDRNFFKRYNPNRLVYRLLLNAHYGIEDDGS